jgi:glycosyltransferase involved in cell wall biosynthesis
MRILLVGHSFPRYVGDMAGNFLLALSQRQRACGHEVRAVVPHAAGLAMRETLGGIDVVRYRYGPDAAETLAYTGAMADQVMRSWAARGRMLRFLGAARRTVQAEVRAFRPDVVHCHWWFPNAFATMPSPLAPAAVRRVPIVLTSHGTDLFLLDRLPAARRLAAPFFRGAAQVTVISTPLVARVTALGVPPAAGPAGRDRCRAR